MHLLGRCCQADPFHHDLAKGFPSSKPLGGIQNLDSGQLPFTVIVHRDAFGHVLCCNGRLAEGNAQRIYFCVIQSSSRLLLLGVCFRVAGV